MKQITIPRRTVNLPLLDQTLRIQLNEGYIGTSIADEHIIVHVRDGTDGEMLTEARQILEMHDATVLTDTQQARQARKAQLETARADDPAIMPDDVQNEAPLLQKMAHKLQRLELEIQELRGE